MADKPNCFDCHVSTVCFMPVEISKFQDNFKSVLHRGADNPSFTRVVREFKEFIAGHCKFYRDECEHCKKEEV